MQSSAELISARTSQSERLVARSPALIERSKSAPRELHEKASGTFERVGQIPFGRLEFVADTSFCSCSAARSSRPLRPQTHIPMFDMCPMLRSCVCLATVRARSFALAMFVCRPERKRCPNGLLRSTFARNRTFGTSEEFSLRARAKTPSGCGSPALRRRVSRRRRMYCNPIRRSASLN